MSFLTYLKKGLIPVWHWQRMLLAMLSGLLLAFGYLSEYAYLLTWIAFVPLLIAIQGRSLKQTYGLGLAFGIAYSMSATYWIVDFIALFKNYTGWSNVFFSLLFWGYGAQLPALAIVLYQWLKRTSKIHDFIVFPLVIVTFYAVFPMLFSVQLGGSQSHFLTAIQATDLFGVSGLDALIALVNIFIFRMLFLSGKSVQPFALCSVIAIVILWFGYGMYTLHEWDNRIAGWETKRIGLVQPNETPTLERTKPYPGYSRAYPVEMDMTERLVLSGAELVVWPEARYKAYMNYPHVKQAFQQSVARLGVDLVFQDKEQRISWENGIKSTVEYNTAVVLDKKGQEVGVTHKSKRVAFGEYIPLVSDFPALRRIVESFFGEFLNEIGKGDGPEIQSTGKVKLLPLICYETTFSGFVAGGVPQMAGGAILVGLSSNGWFGNSLQPYQHVYTSSLRAVENRLPMIHAVNNGPSSIMLPNGRFIFTSDYQKAGGYVVDMPYSPDSGGSFYSSHPNAFLNFVYSILAGLILFYGLRSACSKAGYKPTAIFVMGTALLMVTSWFLFSTDQAQTGESKLLSKRENQLKEDTIEVLWQWHRFEKGTLKAKGTESTWNGKHVYFEFERIYEELKNIKVTQDGVLLVDEKTLDILNVAFGSGPMVQGKRRLQLQEMIKTGLPGKIGDELSRIVIGFNRYLIATEQMAKLELSEQGLENHEGHYDNNYKELKSIRELYLGRSVAEKLFSDEEARLKEMMKAMSQGATKGAT